MNLTSTGSAAVQLSAGISGVTLGTVTLGSGTFTVSTTGDIVEDGSAGGLTQTGAGPISLTSGSANGINLANSKNNFLGTVTVPGGGTTDVILVNRGDLTLVATAALGGTLALTAGGTVTLPTTSLTGLTNLSVTAHSTTVSSNITASGGISFTGGVTFNGGAALTLSTTNNNVNLTANVTVAASTPLTFNVGTGQVLWGGAAAPFGNVTWNQGTSNLTVNSTNATGLVLGNDPGDLFAMTGGTISVANNGNVEVNNGTFRVRTGPPPAAETVTVSTGSGNLNFDPGTTFEVGLGATPDQLLFTGTGAVNLGTNQTRLLGDGPATTPATIISATGGGTVLGAFIGSFDPQGHAAPQFIGGDIVQAAYTNPGGFTIPSQVVLTQATQADINAEAVLQNRTPLTVQASGAVSGTTLAGDTFVVSSSLGTAAGLVVMQDPNSPTAALDIVVRSTTTTASALVISAAVPLQVGGIGVNTAGAVSIMAPTADLATGYPLPALVTTAGTLALLQVRDISSGSIITGGGPNSGSTTLLARQVANNVTIALNSVLGLLQATSVGLGSVSPSATITAWEFGSIVTTGNAALGNAGDFSANLANLGSAPTGLVSASIAGTVYRTWDLRGAVGTVMAHGASNWQLGVAPGAFAVNGDGITTISALNLGSVTGTSGINATGGIGSIVATNLGDGVHTITIQARTIAYLIVTGDPASNLNGDASNLNLTLLGAPNAYSLAFLSVSGSLLHSGITVKDGFVYSIAVGQEVDGDSITAQTTATGGGINFITAGDWGATFGNSLNAKWVGSIAIVGNLAAGLLGNFNNSTVTLTRDNGPANGAYALTSFSTAGNVIDSNFNIQGGNVFMMSIDGLLDGTASAGTINLSDPNWGILGYLTVGQWGSTAGDNLTARAVGYISVVGAAGSTVTGARLCWAA